MRVIMSLASLIKREKERERERERPRDDSILFQVSNFEYLGFFVFFLFLTRKKKVKKNKNLLTQKSGYAFDFNLSR